MKIINTDMKKVIEVEDESKRIKYIFQDANVGDVIVYKFFKLESAKLARCAAHMIAHNREWKFKTKIRETDAGLYEITVARVS